MSTSEFRLSKHGSPLKWWSGLQIQYKPPGFLSKRPIPTRLTQFPPSSNLLSKLNLNPAMWAGVRCCNFAIMTFQKAWLHFDFGNFDIFRSHPPICPHLQMRAPPGLLVFLCLLVSLGSSHLFYGKHFKPAGGANMNNLQHFFIEFFVPKQWASRNAHCCWD